MTSKWNISGYINKLEKVALEDALQVIGAQSVSWAADNFRKRGYSPATKKPTRNLVNNLSYATSVKASQPKSGESLTKSGKTGLKVGGNIAYLARYELGFTGRDSLGRLYNQAPRPILRSVFTEHKTEILKILQTAINNQRN